MPDQSKAELLDRCIDALLRGSDWRRVVPGGAGHEITPLMEVAETIRDVSGKTPEAGPRERLHLWARVFGRRTGGGPGGGLAFLRQITGHGRPRRPPGLRFETLSGRLAHPSRAGMLCREAG